MRAAFERLRSLAAEHKDGWGVATFEGQRRSLEHRVLSAEQCERFAQLGDLEVRAMMVHIRLASVGTVHERNNHPFASDHLVFMHNGTLKHFERARERFEAEIDPRFLGELRGETDSERCFALFRTLLAGRTDAQSIADALVRTFRRAEALCDDDSEGKRSAMNFLVGDGVRFFATRRDRTLFTASDTGFAAIASEALPLEGATWNEVPEDSLVTIDEALRLRVQPIPA